MEGFGLPGSQLPPGFRFHPTDQELIIHYLRKKVTSTPSAAVSIITDIDLYKFNPWELPDKALFGEGEWFFFSPRDRKYPNGARPNRAAGLGYWKATGTDKPILASVGSQCLGVKKALVFYKGRPPKGIKTDWVMHEYRLLESTSSSSHKPMGSMRLDDWVLCRVRQKGSLPIQIEEQQGSSTSNMFHPFMNNNFMEKQLARERNTMLEGSDYQLLAYLLGGSQEELGESACENSDHGSPKSSCIDVVSDGSVEEGQAPVVSSSVQWALDSIKRTLSFGALDEMMLLPPSKRQNCWSSTVGEQSSPTGSVSVDQVFSGFLI